MAQVRLRSRTLRLEKLFPGRCWCLSRSKLSADGDPRLLTSCGTPRTLVASGCRSLRTWATGGRRDFLRLGMADCLWPCSERMPRASCRRVGSAGLQIFQGQRDGRRISRSCSGMPRPLLRPVELMLNGCRKSESCCGREAAALLVVLSCGLLSVRCVC